MGNILCIDVGGTRIKAAILRNGMGVRELKDVKITAINTLGWLNQSLPEIISKDNKYSLPSSNQALANYNMVSVGVPLEVKNHGRVVSGRYVEKSNVPTNLLREIESKAKCKVKVMNDIEAWIRGTVNYLELNERKIDYPCLFIICGTGVGIGYVKTRGDIKNFEISEQWGYFKNTSKVSKMNVEGGWVVHDVLGKSFFSWVREEKVHWDYKRLRMEYTARLGALLKDIEKMNLFNFSKVHTIFIGGGSADYISHSINKVVNKNIVILKEKKLEINPMLIPLLGHININ